jgi:hypothetical protein
MPRIKKERRLKTETETKEVYEKSISMTSVMFILKM